MKIKSFLPYLLIVTLVIIFHWRLVFLGEIFAHSDVFISFYPMKAFASELLKKLTVPLWNPYWFMGHPALAESQTGFFYPINLILFYFLPTHTAYSLSTVIHYMLAGIFTLLFARKLGLKTLPSLLASVTFTFSGFYVTHTFHVWATQSAVWLPLLLLLVEKIYERLHLRNAAYIWALILGLILGMQFLIGHYQIQIINTLAVIAYYVLKFPVREKRGVSILKHVYPLFISLFIAIGVSAIQWIPSFEASQFSGRAGGLSAEWAYENSFHPLCFITFIFPYLFGYSISGFYGTPYLGFGGHSLWEVCGYVGILPLIFAISSVCLLKGVKAVKTLLILAVIFMLLAMGKYGLIYIPFHHLPVIESFKSPGRFLIVVTLAMSALAGFGFQWISDIGSRIFEPESQIPVKTQGQVSDPKSLIPNPQSQIKKGVIILLLASLGIIISLNLAAFLLKGYVQSFETGLIGKVGSHYDKVASVFAITSPRVFSQLFIIFASVIIIRVWLKSSPASYLLKWWGGRLFKASVISLVIADLFYFGIGYTPSTDHRIYTETPESAKILKSQHGSFGERTLHFGSLDRETDSSLFRIYSWRPEKLLEDGFRQDGSYHYEEIRECIPPSSNILYGLEHVSGSASLVSKRNQELIWMERIKDIPVGPENLIRYPRIMGMLNIKYVLSSEEIAPNNKESSSPFPPSHTGGQEASLSGMTGDGLELVYNDVVKIYKNKYVMPRAYLVSDYKVFSDEDSILNEMKSDHFDPQRYAILEEEPDFQSPRGTDGLIGLSLRLNRGQSQAYDIGDVVITDYKNESVKITADVKKAGLFVLGDTWYPGWKAFVDGTERKIYRVNYVQRGVFLKDGSHKIEFIYAPRSFTIGMIITLFTLLTVVVLIITLLKITKKVGSVPPA